MTTRSPRRQARIEHIDEFGEKTTIEEFRAVPSGERKSWRPSSAMTKSLGLLDFKGHRSVEPVVELPAMEQLGDAFR